MHHHSSIKLCLCPDRAFPADRACANRGTHRVIRVHFQYVLGCCHHMLAIHWLLSHQGQEEKLCLVRLIFHEHRHVRFCVSFKRQHEFRIPNLCFYYSIYTGVCIELHSDDLLHNFWAALQGKLGGSYRLPRNVSGNWNDDIPGSRIYSL